MPKKSHNGNKKKLSLYEMMCSSSNASMIHIHKGRDSGVVIERTKKWAHLKQKQMKSKASEATRNTNARNNDDNEPKAQREIV